MIGYLFCVRNYVTGEQLGRTQLRDSRPTAVAFNPANWREIAVAYETQLAVFRVEQNDKECIINTL